MSSDFLAGTGFHKDNDIYSRMADDKIVIKGKHYINSTPPIALAARINQTSIISEAPKENNSPVLVKANQMATYLPGEGFSVSIDPAEFDTVVEIEPRREAPEGFVTNHLQEIENGMIRIKNMSREPKKIKINTPICQVRKTVDTELQIKNNKGRKDKIKETKPKKEIKVDLSKIKIDPGEQLTEIERKEIREMLKKYEDIFGNDLPGYNHKFGKVEASFQWASLARPPISRARMPDYNSAGNALFNRKAEELLERGIFKKAAELNIQPALKNNSFLVKKQSAADKSWEMCETKDTRM